MIELQTHAPNPARPRRLRGTAGLQRLVRETRLTPAHLVHPLITYLAKDAAGWVAGQ